MARARLGLQLPAPRAVASPPAPAILSRSRRLRRSWAALSMISSFMKHTTFRQNSAIQQEAQMIAHRPVTRSRPGRNADVWGRCRSIDVDDGVARSKFGTFLWRLRDSRVAIRRRNLLTSDSAGENGRERLGVIADHAVSRLRNDGHGHPNGF